MGFGMWILPDLHIMECRRIGGKGILPCNWDEHLLSPSGTGHWHEREVCVSQSSLCRAKLLSNLSVV